MENSRSDSYSEAGVDLTAGYRAAELIKKHAARTAVPGADTSIGGFSGTFAPDLSGVEEPVFVSGTDGVGTKLKIAFELGRHDTVGIDCVAMCVNDIVCSGAKPLFFLDYIACGKNFPEKIAEIVSGIAEGCVRAGCALIGGETAEHPGMMPENEYDLAGFAVGMADRKKMLSPDTVCRGDAVIALPSSGVHSNGFSLVRKILADTGTGLDCVLPELGGSTLGETLLTPTKIYVRQVLSLMERFHVRSAAHITGGGFYENIPRSVPEGFGVVIRRSDIRVLPVFDVIMELGCLTEREMFNVFNMGVGMTVIVPGHEADAAVRMLRDSGENAYIIGTVERRSDRVTIC